MVTRVRVIDSKIISVIQVGEVGRWTHDTAKEIERVARALSRKRTGRMRDSHVTLPTTGSNAYQKRYRISVNAPYALYNHQGTGIYGPKGARIRYRYPTRVGAEIGGKVVFFRSQRGTPGDPWLETAALGVAATI